MSNKIKIYCIRRTGKTITGDIFKFIADAALRMFYKEQKRFKIKHGDVALSLKTKFEETYYCGIRGTIFEVDVVADDDHIQAVMIGQVQTFEGILDEDSEILDIVERRREEKEAKLKEEKEPKKAKSRIPTPSLN